jgi:hypothetical protein
MKNSQLVILGIFIVGILTYSCSETNNSTAEIENQIIDTFNSDQIIKKNAGKLFRMVNLNDSLNSVLSVEDDQFIIKDTIGEIHYKYTIDEDNTYELAYTFKNERLTQIDLITFFTKENAQQFKDDVKAAYIPQCINILDKDLLLTMDSKNGKWFLDIDYVDIHKGIIDLRFSQSSL